MRVVVIQKLSWMVKTMKKFGMAVLIMLMAALSLTAIAYSLDGVEYRPAEKAMEKLFEKGIGGPWVGGDPFTSDIFKSDGTQMGQKQMTSIQFPLSSCQLMGFLKTDSGLIIASDKDNSLKLSPGPGNYPVYGCFEDGKLMGLFIDFRFLSI
ncbi:MULTISPECIES: hypothetical protein [Methanothrix]|nr:MULTISPECIES: hypothetical protein [Methanothrix]MBP7068270.1 hypothetical protein [Methanothrix sp.]MDD3551217.1 hypothetical protein [Methanothrix soehngenii]MDY0411567.1 hypothetical protein [Methanothrix soehngenii]NLJ21546.1 hypothetical protein [Methanothrix soehngenii]HNQ52520.1 hypothetical protein [Methanothrix soehngenii]